MTAWWKEPATWRKGQLALASFIAVLVSQGLLSGTAEAVVNGAVTLAGALLVLMVPNGVSADPTTSTPDVDRDAGYVDAGGIVAAVCLIIILLIVLRVLHLI